MTAARRGPDREDVGLFAGVEDPGPAIYLLLAWSLLVAGTVVTAVLVLAVQALAAHL